MVEAPARDSAFYLARRQRPEIDADNRKDTGYGDFLQYKDRRTTEIAKGYATQAVFYVLTGEPFCDDPSCRLYNAHWQREMLLAQLGDVEYCQRHRRLLRSWANTYSPERGE